jgi:DNA-binding transcriptional LysR family regulator
LFRANLHAITDPTRTALTRAELQRKRVIITRDLHSLLETQLRSAGLHIPSEQFVLYDEVEGVKKAVEAGLGVGFTFATAIDREVEHGYLKRVDVEGLEIVIPFKLVFPATQASDELIRDITILAQTQVHLRELARSG